MIKPTTITFAITLLTGTIHAACPAAPVGKASDAVVQLVTSGTAGFGPTSTLDARREGSVVYDSASNQVKYCDGTDWNALLTSNAATVPTGAVMAFDLAACPSGWTEYTLARGRFLRGIDNGAGNDPSGTRALGNIQPDSLAAHQHRESILQYSPYGTPYGYDSGTGSTFAGGTTSSLRRAFTENVGGSETRPKNVAVLFCRKS